MRLDDPITEEEWEAYRADRWYCKVPDVCTAYWDDVSWIKWIRASGGFTNGR